MKWLWHGAYVFSQSQETVATAIRTTVEKSTEYNLRSIPDYYEYEMAAGALQFIGVSPQNNGWTAFWGMTPRLCTLIMERNRFSGLFLHGGDKLLDEATSHSNYWCYMIWMDGLLLDWFILNPETFFSYWSDVMLEKVVYPYLGNRGARKNSDLSPSKYISDLIQSDLGYFSGDSRLLEHIVRKDIEEDQIRAWKALPANKALQQCDYIFDIPFLGSKYDAFGIAVYHDVIRGNISSNPQDYPFDDPRIMSIYNLAKSNMDQIDEIQPLAFQWADGRYQSDDYLRKYNFEFYWG